MNKKYELTDEIKKVGNTIYQCDKCGADCSKYNMSKCKTMVASVIVAVCASIMLGCGKQPAQAEHDEPPRIEDYPCACKESHIRIVVTDEVIATEDIGKRYEVQTHHYYPWTWEDEGRESRVEVAVGYPKQYLLEGEPTDTSITNEPCFCGGPWEFTTNGYFSCKRITIRTGMCCTVCGGAVWETNVTVYAESKEDAKCRLKN